MTNKKEYMDPIMNGIFEGLNCIFNDDKRITLLGTINGDQKGQDRLNRALYDLKPDIITVEDSSSNERYINKILEKEYTTKTIDYLNHVTKDNKKELYEVKIAKEYAKQNNIPIEYIKVNHYKTAVNNFIEVLKNQQYIPTLNSITENSTLEEFTKMQQEIVDQEYNTSKDQKLEALETIFELGLGKPFRSVAKSIEDVYSNNKDKHIVHIGGFIHNQKYSLEGKNEEYNKQNFTPTKWNSSLYDLLLTKVRDVKQLNEYN